MSEEEEGVRMHLKRFLPVAVLVAALTAAVLVAGCGSSSSGSSSSSSSTTSSTGPVDQKIVTEAKAAVAAATGPTTKWTGPTSAPMPESGKKIACVMYQGTDITAALWCKGVEEAAKEVGWESTTFDGKGTAGGQRTAFQSAIALNPEGIILASVDPSSQAALTKEAVERGITLIGIHSATDPGPAPKEHLFTNITYDGKKQAELGADVAIAESGGTGGLIVITDLEYAIAREKAYAAKERIEECSSCKLLEFKNSPAATAETNMPPLFNSYLQKYQEPFYVYTVSDYYFDTAAPALRAADVPPSGRVMLIGSDGSPAAYERIKNGEYEIGTIPEPVLEQGWQAVDELNRAFHGEEPSEYLPPLHLITKENIERDVDGDHYEPQDEYKQHYKEIWGLE
jgi:ribose transport system substrate-binding protein